MDYLLNYPIYGPTNVVLNVVLNLIINGLPSKQRRRQVMFKMNKNVLNLIINGLPSKRSGSGIGFKGFGRSFKPYYKWITF